MTTTTPNPKAGWPDNDTLAPLFDVVRAARALVKQHTQPLADSSKADYERRLPTMLREIDAVNWTPGIQRFETYLSRHAPVSRTFHKCRAILCRHLAQVLEDRLKMQDRFQRLGDFDVWQGSVQALDTAVKDLEWVHQLKRADLLASSNQESVNSKSKKDQKLPRGWADKILEKSLNHRFYKAILTLCITGCRPGEISDARFIYAGEKIHVEIKGKKVTETNGQPLRQFVIPTEKLPAHFLRELQSAGELKVTEVSTEREQKSLRMYLNRLGAEEFPKLKEKISPISFRHAMASALRNAGWEKSEMAKVLGHASEQTQFHYGARRRFKGKRPNAPIEKDSAEATHPVRKGKTSAFLGDNPPVFENTRRAIKAPKLAIS